MAVSRQNWAASPSIPESSTVVASKSDGNPQTAVLVGVCWLLSSALFSTWSNTAFLKHFNNPLLHVMVRFSGAASIGLISLLMTRSCEFGEIPSMLQQVFLPALFLWVANFANSASLQLSGITLTYVVKACIPVFTVALCTIRGQKFPLMTYISLLPTVLGVALASASDLDFTISGLLAALTSALAQTFMNVTVKEVRTKTGFSGSKILASMTAVCSLLTLPLLLFSNSFGHLTIPDLLVNGWWNRGIMLIIANALAFHAEYVLNMIFVGYVNSVTFSVTDVARRLGIILCGAVVFGKMLTTLNVVGVALALSGVLWYSYLETVFAKDKKKAT
eukprot:CAMPEP_0182425006 /NCGR_PEP_ID=MMETSP1167-20130531/11330_1 /TAXON_ID=2988 /ORGANISM="Mallomonas Sp, Strain CCMP3275" /LENGTH=332 /DNA_ID=CAMNT_0024605291 /DNA_START=109 /DNA_END=1107 /DNA_ORIENTATION=-